MQRAASQKWNVPIEEVYADKATVYHRKSPKKAFYNELITEANQVHLEKNAPLKSTSDYKLIGNENVTSIDARVKSLGQAEFGIDYNMPDLLVAVVERSPTFAAVFAVSTTVRPRPSLDISPLYKSARVSLLSARNIGKL